MTPDRQRRTYRLEDPEALRALAHPLRGRLLAALRIDGPATASMLARRYGESSGSTSYHLRALARYGFVEDDPDHAGGRERWWRAAHEYTTWSPTSFLESAPEEGEAARQFMRRLASDYARWQGRWIDELESWDPDWQEAATMSDLAMRLTPAQLASLVEEVTEVLFRYREAGPDGDGTAERVMVVFDAFPQRGTLP
jgi:DNA-binding transcriptional ArsR family regulator